MPGCKNLEEILTPELVRSALEENPFERIGSIVYRVLEDAILSADLKPGMKLNVAKLAGCLDVSTTPVREAVEQLTGNGLVTVRQKEDSKYSNYYVFDITNQSIQNLHIARKSVESTAAYLCAQENWLVDLSELGRLAEVFQKTLIGMVDKGPNAPGAATAAEADRQFHELLVHSTGNEFLTGMYATITKKLDYLSRRTNQFLAQESNMNNLLRLGSQHISIYRAIKFGFSDLARSCMDDHIDFCMGLCMQNRNLVQ